MNTTTLSVHIIIIIMSFLNISDPKKRDTVVNEYLALVKKIQQEKMNEKAGELTRVENLKQVFDPVVQSTEKSTTAITKELAPLREEMRNLNENLIAEKTQMAGRKRKRDELTPPPPEDNVLQHYLHKSDKGKLDKYFGIQYTRHGNYMMGDKEVTVDKQSNIHVDGNTYKATVGLWALVMEAVPKENEYTNNDLNVYADLVQKTNILYYPPLNLTAHSRYKKTYKWKNILMPIRDWGYQQHSSHDHQGSASSSSPSYSPTITSPPTDENLVDGSGIQFLPTDIKGLTKKLHLLLAEFAAGNKTSTRNEIIFILDELLRRKKISRKEYTDINSYLSRCL